MLPKKYGCYFEPFLGGGSVFFYLRPPRAVLADVNSELIQLFRVVAWRRRSLEALLREHQSKHNKRHYYSVRSRVPNSAIERAARTLYLNRTCFNGMYRVNRAGEFNVPKGVKFTVLMETDDFVASSRLLRRAELVVSDFEPIINKAKKGDLVFADPPYVVGHNNNGFVKYNERLFSWEDQTRLANTLDRARRRGVKIVATNAAHGAIEKLYLKRSFSISRVRRYSSISGDSEGRSKFQELIISANCE